MVSTHGLIHQCAASSILALSTRDRPLRSRKYGDTLVWYQAVRHRGRSTSGPRHFLSHTGHSIVVNKYVGVIPIRRTVREAAKRKHPRK